MKTYCCFAKSYRTYLKTQIQATNTLQYAYDIFCDKHTQKEYEKRVYAGNIYKGDYVWPIVFATDVNGT